MEEHATRSERAQARNLLTGHAAEFALFAPLQAYPVVGNVGRTPSCNRPHPALHPESGISDPWQQFDHRRTAAVARMSSTVRAIRVG
jgi:hypothetical protein